MSPQTRNIPSDDELDAILDGLVQGRDLTPSHDTPSQSKAAAKGSGNAGDGLGIDEEIIITKKRIPIPKLDDHRLLSDAGIPRLRKISKERLRFKGKGHEVGLRCFRTCLETDSITVRRHCPHAEHVSAVA
jgi:replication fork protection complex subunit Csm3/Swi3